ncbi:hypothetical protein ABBQ32_000510 [Trebouxia sp. C0010 RCD-2024]
MLDLLHCASRPTLQLSTFSVHLLNVAVLCIRHFHEHLKQQHVDPLLLTSTSGNATATCLCLLTPDGERTMRTHLGASSELESVGQLPEGWTHNCRLLHCEGYCLYKLKLTQGAMRAAKQSGAEVSLDTASFEVVRNCWQSLLSLLQEGLVDLLLCNEDEALAVAEMAGISCKGSDLDRMLAAQQFLLQHCKVCVVSRGSKSCLVCTCNGEHFSCDPPEVTVVDTVGAGDCFAAGFLHAYIGGAGLQACAVCGCILGSEAVSTAGAELSLGQWEKMRHSVAKKLTEFA